MTDARSAGAHLQAAENLLATVENQVSETVRHQTGEFKTDVLLAALTHAVIALVKQLGERKS